MDFVAIHHRLSGFVRRHQRREAADGTLGVLGEDVAKLWGLHLLPLLRRVPAFARVLIVSSARLVDQVQTGLELRPGQVLGSREAQAVSFARLRMRPTCLPWWPARGAARRGIAVRYYLQQQTGGSTRAERTLRRDTQLQSRRQFSGLLRPTALMPAVSSWRPSLRLSGAFDRRGAVLVQMWKRHVAVRETRLWLAPLRSSERPGGT